MKAMYEGREGHVEKQVLVMTACGDEPMKREAYTLHQKKKNKLFGMFITIWGDMYGFLSTREEKRIAATKAM